MSQMLMLIMAFSLPAIMVSTFLGVIVSIIQAVTQVQEQNLAFLVKLVAIFMVLYMSMPWVYREMLHFTKTMFNFSHK